MTPEKTFEKRVCKELQIRYPGCVILKNNASLKQGMADRSIIFGSRCAILEFKKSGTSPHRPNQDYYVASINRMGGFARFIYPENKEQVMVEIDRYFKGN